MIEFEQQGNEAILRGFRKLASMDASALMSDLGNMQVDNIKKGLMKGTDIYGGKLKPSQRALFDGGATLIDTGAMTTNMSVLEFTSDMAKVGFSSATEAKKAHWHQHGIPEIRPKKAKALRFKVGGEVVFAKSVSIPARPWFGFRPGDAKKLSAAFNRWARKFMDKAFRG